jgi:hypothetical protein
VRFTIGPRAHRLLSSGAAVPEGWTIADELTGREGTGIGTDPRPTGGRRSYDNRIARWLEPWSGRPTLFGVAAINAITGITIAAILGPHWFGADASTYRQCAQSVVEGADCGSLYPPLAALAFRPLTWVDATTAYGAMTLIGIAILLAGVWLETRGQAPADRALVLVAAVTFAPVVCELIFGQVTLLIAAAMYPVARRADRFQTGIPLGIALAIAPKPLLLPVLFWMLVWRRHALVATLATAVGLTCLGVVLAGPDQYQRWLSVITTAGSQSAAGTLALSRSGNYSLWPLTEWTLFLALAVGAATVWTILRDPSRGFVAAILASLLLAPYTGLYAASILLLAVRPALEFAPRATRVLALTANLALGLLFGLGVWGVAGVAACLPRYADREPDG